MEKEKNLKLCGGVFFTLILKARKTPKPNQDECFRELMKIFDRSVDALRGNSLSTIASRFRKCDPTLKSDYIHLGDEVVVDAFCGRLKKSYSSVLDEVVQFAEKYLDLETYGDWLVKALLDIVISDDSIKDNAKLYINPGFLPSYKSEILKGEIDKVYFHNFILGIWQYVCAYCDDNGIGAITYKTITDDNGESRGRSLKEGVIGTGSYDRLDICYEIVSFIENDDKFEEDESAGRFPLIGEDDIAPDLGEFNPEDVFLYHSVNSVKAKGKYATYLSRAYDKHCEKKTFLYETQRAFYDFFVCNDIKRRIVTPIAGLGIKGSGRDNPVISNVCIDTFLQDRNFVIITGTGGIGKSMMMTHFMLSTINKYNESGRIPIFVLLRNYNPEEGDLEDFIFCEFKRHDKDLKLSDMIEILNDGHAVVLMDGLDELKAERREQFNKEIDKLVDNYPDAFYVMSSRPTINFRAYNRFTVYDLQLFTQEQSVKMIEKLDQNVIDRDIQHDFIKDLKANRFNFSYEEKTDFLGNPLFLTIMLLTYEGNHDIPSQRYLFYEQAYDAMAKKHDATKSLTREFSTGLSSRDFQYYFGEFCAITYEQEKYDFTTEEISDCFQEVIEANQIDTTAEAFIDDITGKICLMYLDGDKYYFVHRSFQEYFVAYFFSKQLEQTYDAVLDLLMSRDETDHDSMVLPMLHGIDSKKTELCVFIPFLKELFENQSEKNNYKYYLTKIYPTFCYESGETDEFPDDTSESAIYNFIVNTYDLKECIVGGELPDEDMNVTWEYTYYDKNWDKPEKEESYQLIKTCELPDGYREYYKKKTGEDIEIVGRLHQIDVKQAYASTWGKEAVKMFEDELFPLKKEYIAVKKKYEELKNTYERRSKKSWISRFH
ncbi:MAG: NACHT domain-containing protein [Acetatifactor sp.]|nr:NACHT domain-containing protein [Acetatifactor sp.]